MNIHLVARGVFLPLLMLFSFGLLAESIQPDRPGFSTGTYTVAPGKTQIELGFQSSYGDHAGDPDSFTAPLINVRAGLTPSTEINLLLDGWTQEHSGGGTVTSTSDLMVGAKYRLLSGEKYNLSLLGFGSLPTGNTPDSGYFTPFLGLLWDYELAPKISAFGTFQFISFVENGPRSNNFQPAIGLSFLLTDRFGSYIEYYRDMPLNIDALTNDMFDAGMTYLLNDDMQLDFNFGFSINRISSDFIGAGFAVRF